MGEEIKKNAKEIKGLVDKLKEITDWDPKRLLNKRIKISDGIIKGYIPSIRLYLPEDIKSQCSLSARKKQNETEYNKKAISSKKFEEICTTKTNTNEMKKYFPEIIQRKDISEEIIKECIEMGLVRRTKPGCNERSSAHPLMEFFHPNYLCSVVVGYKGNEMYLRKVRRPYLLGCKNTFSAKHITRKMFVIGKFKRY